MRTERQREECEGGGASARDKEDRNSEKLNRASFGSLTIATCVSRRNGSSRVLEEVRGGRTERHDLAKR